MKRNLGQFLKQNQTIHTLGLTAAEQEKFVQIIDEDYFQQCLSSIVSEVEAVVNIDPALSEAEILKKAAEIIVKALQAQAVSIRLFDPTSFRMLAFGAYGLEENCRTSSIPVKESIAGKVVQENRSIAVPSILNDPYYKDKSIVSEKGFHSLLATPLHIPRFSETHNDLLGAMQIYYRSENKDFSPVEITYAELLSRRVSFVLAQKKILNLQELNLRKEKISDKIFRTISNRQGVKLKDFFVLIIPELRQFLQVRCCSLFSLSDDQQYLHTEAAYPLDLIYHEPGHNFVVAHHPYFAAIINGDTAHGDHPYERFAPSYLLIKEPLQSKLISKEMGMFVEQQQIHSILLVPLKLDGKVRHILVFYATDQKKFFTDEEIDLLIFFGKEIIKASKLEFLSDMLHDLKNPAVAVAGLAKRAMKLLQADDLNLIVAKLTSYLDVVSSETARLQDIAMTIVEDDKKKLLDFASIARQRFLINEEVIREYNLKNIHRSSDHGEESLLVSCPLFGLERILDNLFHNATKAIPSEGGSLNMKCYREDNMACLEVCNSGEIPANQIEQVRSGQVRGRGLNIIQRFVQTQHGSMDILAGSGMTTFIIKLPLANEDSSLAG